MVVTCPNCAADYNLPDSLLSGGPRKLRCAKCATMFHSHALTPAPASSSASAPAPSDKLAAPSEPPVLRAPAPQEKPLPSSPPRSRIALQFACVIIAWVISLGAAGGASWAVIDQRAAIMHAWAPSQRAYRAMGLLTTAEADAKPTAAPEAPAMSPKELPPG